MLRAARLAALSLAIGVLVAFAALIPMGDWHPDEFALFHALEPMGLRGWWWRVSTWSPRPFSEFALLLYQQAVAWAQRPLITPVLLVAWAGPVAAAASLPFAQQSGLAARLTLSATVLATIFLVAPVGELFYWPAAALAYLPVLAAMLFLTFSAIGGADGRRTEWPGACVLLCAAASAEVGAMFAAGYASALLFGGTAARLMLWHGAVERTGEGKPRRAQLPWVLVLLSALTILAALAMGRVDSAGEQFAATPMYRDAALSLRAAVQTAWREALDWRPDPSGREVAQALVAKLLLLIGTRACVQAGWPGVRLDVVRTLATALALAGIVVGTLGAAFYQFGTPCCERHQALRQAAILLLIVLAAAALATLRRPRLDRWNAVLGPMALASALLLLFVPRTEDLLAEYRLFPQRAAARAALWQSGTQPGQALLRYPLPPEGPLLSSHFLQPGSYRYAPDLPWVLKAPMEFFGKTDMTVEPPPAAP